MALFYLMPEMKSGTGFRYGETGLARRFWGSRDDAAIAREALERELNPGGLTFHLATKRYHDWQIDGRFYKVAVLTEREGNNYPDVAQWPCNSVLIGPPAEWVPLERAGLIGARSWALMTTEAAYATVARCPPGVMLAMVDRLASGQWSYRWLEECNRPGAPAYLCMGLEASADLAIEAIQPTYLRFRTDVFGLTEAKPPEV